MQIFLVMIGVLLTATLTCNKKEDLVGKNQYITLSYAQTQCADPWKTGATDSLTARNVSRFLDSAGVNVASVTIKADGTGGANCAACICPTGKIIYVSILDDDHMRARLEQFKFQ